MKSYMIILSTLFLYVQSDDIQPWLVWGYWASPLTYGQNAVALNEFLDERWSMVISVSSKGTIFLNL